MQLIEPVRPSQHVSIAGLVIDDFTQKALPGAQVRIVAAPEAFVRRVAITARQVWLGTAPVLGDPQAALDSARVVLRNRSASLRDRVAAANVIFNNPLATSADEFPAAQAALDYKDSQLAVPARRLDQSTAAVDGSFFFLNLPDGDYALRAWLPNAGRRYADGEASTAVPMPAPMARLSLPPTGLAGRIVDAASTSAPKAGIEMAELRIEGSGESTFSAFDLDPQKSGAYQLIGLEKGARKVRVFAQGFVVKTLPVDLAHGVVTKDQEIALTKK